MTVATKPESKQKVLYFVTMWPEWSITIIPEDFIEVRGKMTKQKARRILFKKMPKPRKLIGTGENSTATAGQPSKNSSPYWGIFETSDNVEIEFLRNHGEYKRTPQDNKVQSDMFLKEHDWDPGLLENGPGIKVLTSLAKPKEIVTEQAPSDDAGEDSRARVGLKKK